MCVTFDVHAPTFRHQASEAYKATRKPMPEELRVQVPVLKEVLDALNIPRYEQEGWEADDLIGTISRKCEADGWDCVVVTGDKDSLQLITDHTMVKLVSTRMGQTTTKDMTETAFQEQYGFAPIHMIDLKALMGDSSDNIPGVPGIGEKTAMALIQQYESIDNLYAKMPDIEAKPAAIRKLAEGEESARESYWLATIVTDAPLDFHPEENLCRKPGPDAYPPVFEAGVHQADREVRPVPGGAATAERRTFPWAGGHILRGKFPGKGCMSMSEFFPACAPVHVFAGPPRPGESAGAGGLRRRNVSGGRGKGGGIPAVRGPDPHVLPGADR